VSRAARFDRLERALIGDGLGAQLADLALPALHFVEQLLDFGRSRARGTL
jgi:hypothetical protein